MSNSINYRVETRGGGEFDDTPSVAVFRINEETAGEIVRLSALVRANNLHKVEKFDYSAHFLQFDPEMSPEDAEEAGEKNKVRTACDVLVVEKDLFFFSSYIKHTDVKVSCIGQSIAELAAHFGLAETAPAPKPVRIVIGVEGGIVLGATADVPLDYLVYDYDIKGCNDDEVVTRPALDGGEVEVNDFACTAAAVDAEKIAEIFAAVVSSKQGRIWQTADSPQEAEQWKTDHMAKGAVNVELKPRDDGTTLVDVIITLDRARANEILGYEVEEEEFLTE